MKVLKIIGIVFTSLGLLFAGLAVIFHLEAASFRKDALTATGVVIENMNKESRSSNGTVSITAYPVVRYTTADGETVEFVSRSGSAPPRYRVGESVTVLYHADNPQRARVDNDSVMLILKIVFGGMGSIFAIIGIILLFSGRRSSRRAEWLKSNGTGITAQITEVVRDPSIRVNGRNPYRIEAQWQSSMDGMIYLFRSDPIWFDPEPYMSGMRSVQVLINPDKPKEHWMNTEFLPPAADNLQ